MALLEHFGYSKAIYRQIAASVANPSLLFDFPLTSGDVVYDVGGYEGDWCLGIAARSSGAEIHVFEPSPGALARLERNTVGHADVHIHRYGLGASSRTASIAAKGPGSSLYDTGTEWTRAEVEIRDVVDVVRELGHDRIHVLKLNIEGGEYEVLERMIDTGLTARVDSLLIQFHEWLPRAYTRRRAIRSGLRTTHRLVWDHPWIWERWDRVSPPAS